MKIHEIKAKELPALDDEFAKDADEEVETLAELKEKIENRLKESKKTEAETAVREALVEKASENAEVEIPEVMVDAEVDRMMQEFGQRLQMQGMTLELYFQFSGQSEEDLRGQMKEDAGKRVRTNLTLEAIAAAENLEVTDEEAEEEVTKMAEQYNMSADNIKQALGGLDTLKADLKVRKALEFLVDNSKTVA